MANDLQINTLANPAYIPQPSGSIPGVIPAIVVASAVALNLIVAGTVPVICLAFVRTPVSIWLTENASVSWQQYA